MDEEEGRSQQKQQLVRKRVTCRAARASVGLGVVEGEEASKVMRGQVTKSTEDSTKHLSLSFRWWGGAKKDFKQGNYMNRFIL